MRPWRLNRSLTTTRTQPTVAAARVRASKQGTQPRVTPRSAPPLLDDERVAKQERGGENRNPGAGGRRRVARKFTLFILTSLYPCTTGPSVV